MQKLIPLLSMVMLLSCSPSTSQKTTTDTTSFRGKWMLTAIKFYPQDEIIIPTKDYWIDVSETNFVFKKEANTCHTTWESLDRAGIKINPQIACTKMCCDGDISDKLTYEKVNQYELKKDKLVLTAPDRKFEFTKGK